MPRHLATTPATREEHLDMLRASMGRVAQEYVEILTGRDDVAVLEWAAAVEYSTPEWERGRKASRAVICEADRISHSTIEGLGLFMSGMSR
jgi:hypothetical protein